MKKDRTIKLLCGIELTEVRAYKGRETASLDLTALYQGYGEPKLTLCQWGDVFNEIHELGFTASGMYLEHGYYDSIDGVTLSLGRDIH